MSDIQRKSARKRSIPRKSTNESIDPESENEILEKKKIPAKKSILKKSESRNEQKLLLKKKENYFQSDDENNECSKKLKLSSDEKRENHPNLENEDEDQSEEEADVEKEGLSSKKILEDSETETGIQTMSVKTIEKKHTKKKKKNTEVQTFQESCTEVCIQGAGYVQFRISTRKIF